MLCIGHRGAMGHEPENTLRSMRRALELGVDWIEFDVYLVENRLIVFHDDILDRTTNGKGPLQAQTIEKLRRLDAGLGEKIPFIEEVLDLVQQRAGINIELKGTGTAAPVATLVQSYIDKGWKSDRFLISSFHASELRKMHLLSENLQLGVLVDNDIQAGFELANELDAFSLNLPLRNTTQEAVNKAHANNHKVLVYTVNEMQDILRMQDYGVDGVFTNFPERLLDLKNSR